MFCVSVVAIFFLFFAGGGLSRISLFILRGLSLELASIATDDQQDDLL